MSISCLMQAFYVLKEDYYYMLQGRITIPHLNYTSSLNYWSNFLGCHLAELLLLLFTQFRWTTTIEAEQQYLPASWFQTWAPLYSSSRKKVSLDFFGQPSKAESFAEHTLNKLYFCLKHFVMIGCRMYNSNISA